MAHPVEPEEQVAQWIASKKDFKESDETTSTPPSQVQDIEPSGAYKLVLVGSAAVGKSYLRKIYCERIALSDDYTAGTGVEFSKKDVGNLNLLNLHIWELNANPMFEALMSSYYRGAHVAIFIYDITSKASFDYITQKIERLKEEGKLTCPILLVGNKNDLDAQRAVSKQEAEIFAMQHNSAVIETNLKELTNVDNIFQQALKKLPANKQSSIVTQPDPFLRAEIDSDEHRNMLGHVATAISNYQIILNRAWRAKSYTSSKRQEQLETLDKIAKESFSAEQFIIEVIKLIADVKDDHENHNKFCNFWAKNFTNSSLAKELEKMLDNMAKENGVFKLTLDNLRAKIEIASTINASTASDADTSASNSSS